MQIQSKFFDCYDSIAHIYGGGDPNVIYRSSTLGSNGVELIRSKTLVERIEVPNPKNYFTAYLGTKQIGKEEFDYELIIIAGKVYPLWAKRDKKFYETFKHGPNDFHVCSPTYFEEHYFHVFNNYELRNNQDVSIHDWAFDWCRHFKQPIIRLAHEGYARWNEYNLSKLYAYEYVPKLASLGFQNVVSPEELYQEIAYFLANTVNESPDVQPIGKPPQSNSEKILSHGFDLKKSFRHRV